MSVILRQSRRISILSRYSNAAIEILHCVQNDKLGHSSQNVKLSRSTVGWQPQSLSLRSSGQALSEAEGPQTLGMDEMLDVLRLFVGNIEVLLASRTFDAVTFIVRGDFEL